MQKFQGKGHPSPYYYKGKQHSIMAGLYIHIPFCESRCIYCGFYSTTSLSLRNVYIDALCREIRLRHDELAGNNAVPINTIYLGGGTPSMLTGEQLTRLFRGIEDGVKIEREEMERMEITMECNPDDVTDDFCNILKRLPVNRISMGAQTFSDKRLRFLHRRHTAQEVRDAVKRLRSIGITNISIDLMFGFPGETLEEWKEDIRQTLELNVEHISAYSLMIEENTVLEKMMKRKKIEELDEETSLCMYETLIDTLTAAGYEHYEISNFARPAYHSRHNSSYWQETPYVGIGAAAHSYSRGNTTTRSWNVTDIKAYISAIQEGTKPCETEELDLDTRYNDLIATALRTREGINLNRLRQEFGEERYQHTLREAQDKIERGLMKIDSEQLSLTRHGLYISDDLMSDFVLVSP